MSGLLLKVGLSTKRPVFIGLGFELATFEIVRGAFGGAGVRFENHVEAAIVDQAVMKDSRSGAKAKASASWASQGLEMPMIQGEHIENAVALGENDDRGVGKANAEVPIAAKYYSG